MSMRICCGTDQHKPHRPDCEREIEWRRRQNERDREARKRQGQNRKGRQRGDKRSPSDPIY